jgi:O-methyltransferase
MAEQTTLSPELLDYLRESSLREDPILRELREETVKYPMGSAQQVMAEEGQLLTFLVMLTGARTAVEVGTFTGYSSLCIARALPAVGRLVTCDVTKRWPAIGQPYWERAGVAERIEVRIGEAATTLPELVTEWGAGSVDFGFIDADKANYPRYYELLYTLVRPGGLIVVDNTLFGGRVADPHADDPDTVAIRELNGLLHADERVDLTVLPMADGITLVRKR